MCDNEMPQEMFQTGRGQKIQSDPELSGVVWTDMQYLGMRWVHLVGEREPVFTELGKLASQTIHSVLESLPEREPLQHWRESADGGRRFGALVETSRAEFPVEMGELLALAEGAGVDPDELICENLRGDIGADDRIGCSDLLGVTSSGAIGAHNEDGAPNLLDSIMLVTLSIAGEPTVTAQWYPGFLPCNAHAVTSAGLGWGINHVQVIDPPIAAGRHFLARHIQRLADAEAVFESLAAHRTAGGFSYNFVNFSDGTATNIEVAAGRTDAAQPVANTLMWHTNHLLRLDSSIDAAVTQSAAASALGLRQESCDRGRYLDALQPDANQLADPQWYLTQLAAKPLPNGVRRDAAGEDPLMTLITTVCDASRQRVIIRNRAGDTADLSLDDYLRREELNRLEQTLHTSPEQEKERS